MKHKGNHQSAQSHVFHRAARDRLRKMRGEFSFMPPGGREKSDESKLIVDSRWTNNAEYFNKIAIELLESFINIKQENS